MTTGRAAPSASSAVAAPSVSWIECRDGFQCATVPAPLDYDDPGGAQIGISVIRLPAAVVAAVGVVVLARTGEPHAQRETRRPVA